MHGWLTGAMPLILFKAEKSGMESEMKENK